MIFLDTCVWIELLGVRTPVKEHEKRQAIAASKLLDEVIKSKEKVVTCKEQLIELVSAIEKVTMRTVNRDRKENNLFGIGNLKEFRKLPEFQNTKRLCEAILSDVKHFADIHSIGDYNIEGLIERLDLADINDCLYYDYCISEQHNFYTFDSDLKNVGDNENLHCYNPETGEW